MRRGPEREHTLLGPGLFLVTAGAAERDIEPVVIECLLQGLGLHDVGVERGPVVQGVDVLLDPLGVDVDQEVHTGLPGHVVPEVVHRLELPAGVDVQERERRRAGVKRLTGQLQHHRRVFPDRVQHHRVLGLRHHLPDDVHRLGLETIEMCQVLATGELVLLVRSQSNLRPSVRVDLETQSDLVAIDLGLVRAPGPGQQPTREHDRPGWDNQEVASLVFCESLQRVGQGI